MAGNLHLVLALHLAAGFLLPGCATTPRYSLRVEPLQKDVVLVLVTVPERLDADGYRRIVEQEIQRILLAQDPGQVPIYEVRFDFLAPEPETGREEKVASLFWTAQSVSADLSPRGSSTLLLY